VFVENGNVYTNVSHCGAIQRCVCSVICEDHVENLRPGA